MSEYPKLSVRPTFLSEANEFVRQHHRHHRPVPGAMFSLGVEDEAGVLHGVAIVGRPVARALADRYTAEIVRVCTDGSRNAASMVLGAARRAARNMGYRTVITYTLPEEGGASLRAAGFTLVASAGKPARGWGSRQRRAQVAVGDDLIGGKWRWEG